MPQCVDGTRPTSAGQDRRSKIQPKHGPKYNQNMAQTKLPYEDADGGRDDLVLLGLDDLRAQKKAAPDLADHACKRASNRDGDESSGSGSGESEGMPAATVTDGDNNGNSDGWAVGG